jgi:hypothetical protein
MLCGCSYFLWFLFFVTFLFYVPTFWFSKFASDSLFLWFSNIVSVIPSCFYFLLIFVIPFFIFCFCICDSYFLFLCTYDFLILCPTLTVAVLLIHKCISTPKDLTIKVYLTNCRCFEHNVFYISLLETWYIYLSLQQGHRGPGSYGSWIYNYLCNQCLLQLMLWVRLPLRARCTTLWSSLSVICGRSVVFSGYSGFLHQ